MNNLNNISCQLIKELNGLENNFSEQLGRLKAFELLTTRRIARLRKMLACDIDGQWAYQIPSMIDILSEVRRSIEQVEGICLSENDVQFESIEGITNEDVLF